MRIYIGGYTSEAREGIRMLELDPDKGELSQPQRVAGATNPSFMAIHPSRRFLYAVSEIGEMNGQKTGAVAGFAIDGKTGRLTPLNQRRSGGAGPCHLSVDATGRNVLVANYSAGSVALLPIAADGTLSEPTAIVQHEGSGPNEKRQEKPHAHSINLSPDNRFAIAADLGADRLFIYRFDPDAETLEANDPAEVALAPGAGPRHFAFHPAGHFAYAINELDSTVTAFKYDAERGALAAVQTVSTLPEGFGGKNTTAEVQVHPSGKFLYGSNRGHDSIAIFAVDPETGRLTVRGHQSTQGEGPRNFSLDPDGAYLVAANQRTGNVVLFRVDPSTGDLSPAGSIVETPAPTCVRFMPPEP